MGQTGTFQGWWRRLRTAFDLDEHAWLYCTPPRPDRSGARQLLATVSGPGIVMVPQPRQSGIPTGRRPSTVRRFTAKRLLSTMR